MQFSGLLNLRGDFWDRKKPIVVKVDRPMALCGRLEAQLAKSQRDCDALLSAIVNHVGTVSQASLEMT